MNAKISAIVPIYKVPEKYLRKCIESIITQTFKNIEIILIDDGSPDNCGKICDEYKAIDSRIKVIHQENKGLCGARNTGVKNATGEWINFIDGDDWIDSRTYEILVNEMNDEDIQVICYGFCRNYQNKIIKNDYSKYFINKKIYKTKEELKYMQEMILNFKANCSAVQTKLIKKDFIEEKNIYHNETLKQGAEDIEFTIRLFNNVKCFKFISNNLYNYVYNDNSITTVHNESNHYMVINCFKEIYNNIDKSDTEILDWFYTRVAYSIVTTAISGYFSYSNSDTYKQAKNKFKKYLEDNLIADTLRYKRMKNIDLQRKIIIFLIKRHFFLFLRILSKIRKIKKDRG